MADELSELDELIESDVLEALGEKVADSSSIEIDGITIEDIEPQEQEDISAEDTVAETEEEIPVQEELTDDTTSSEDTSDEILIEDLEEPSEDIEPLATESSNEKTMNTSDLASLLSELLNNKTIEITIKIKD